MESPRIEPGEARRYLLGRLTPAEMERLEERMVAGDDACDAVGAVEDDLVDAWVRGELRRADRSAFRARLLGTEGMAERIASARALAALAAAAAPPRERRGWPIGRWLAAPRPALAAATALVLVALIAAGGFAWRGAELSRRLERAEAAARTAAGERDAAVRRAARLEARASTAGARRGDERRAAAERLEAAEEKAAALAAELERLRAARAAAPAEVSFLLGMTTRSAAGLPRLVVPGTAGRVRLQLDTGGEEPYPAFRARLLAAGGAVAWSRAGIAPAPPGGPTVELELPAEVLRPGRYELVLEGVAAGAAPELVAAYEFEVRR